MNKFFLFIAGLLIVASASAQTFSFTNHDTIAYGVPGSGLYSSDSLVNNTSVGVDLDIVRVVNDTAPNWETSFCLEGCYPPTVDSVRFFLWPDSMQIFLLDFFTDTIPDTSTVVFKFKNVSNPSNVFYQRFYGIAEFNAGVHEGVKKDVAVNIFPSPVSSGNQFCFRIANKNTKAKDYSLLIYDIMGNKISSINGLTNGDNHLSLNIPEGIYVYTLVYESKPVKTGKMAVSR